MHGQALQIEDLGAAGGQFEQYGSLGGARLAVDQDEGQGRL